MRQEFPGTGGTIPEKNLPVEFGGGKGTIEPAWNSRRQREACPPVVIAAIAAPEISSPSRAAGLSARFLERLKQLGCQGTRLIGGCACIFGQSRPWRQVWH